MDTKKSRSGEKNPKRFGKVHKSTEESRRVQKNSKASAQDSKRIEKSSKEYGRVRKSPKESRIFQNNSNDAVEFTKVLLYVPRVVPPSMETNITCLASFLLLLFR